MESARRNVQAVFNELRAVRTPERERQVLLELAGWLATYRADTERDVWLRIYGIDQRDAPLRRPQLASLSDNNQRLRLTIEVDFLPPVSLVVERTLLRPENLRVLAGTVPP